MFVETEKVNFILPLPLHLGTNGSRWLPNYSLPMVLKQLACMFLKLDSGLAIQAVTILCLFDPDYLIMIKISL